jgi:hypothetical protein
MVNNILWLKWGIMKEFRENYRGREKNKEWNLDYVA